jgi:hypothetical protein
MNSEARHKPLDCNRYVGKRSGEHSVRGHLAVHHDGDGKNDKKKKSKRKARLTRKKNKNANTNETMQKSEKDHKTKKRPTNHVGAEARCDVRNGRDAFETEDRSATSDIKPAER